MKIAIDARPLNSDKKHGIYTYIDRLVFNLSVSKSYNNFDLLFISLKKCAKDLPGPTNDNFRKRVLRFPDRDFKFKKELFTNIVLPWYMKSNKCDVFHSTYDTLSLRMKRTKYVLTVHDLKSLHVKEDTWQQDLPAYKKACELADAIIAVSHSTKNDLIAAFKIPDKKIYVVYEGVDQSFQRISEEDKNILKTTYSLQKPFFFSLGGTLRKNTELLIESFALFKHRDDFDLVLAGVGVNSKRYEKLKALSEKLGIGRSVRFIGYVKSDKDLIGFYNCAECFIFPSLYEGFGLPVLEAMACGTPVITSNVSSLPEVAGDAAIYVNPIDMNSVVTAMEALVQNKNEKERLINQGINNLSRFSWGKMAEQTIKVYERVVGG